METSFEEKQESFRKDGYIEHWLFVGELKELLSKLEDTDWLTPNNVHNLTIGREENQNIGIIDFHTGKLEFWHEEEYEEE